jgi:ubiquinone/menaquinone biosynthesis C-methylase UbiE
MENINKSRLKFWDSRATLGAAAGSNDIILKELEIENISNLLADCETILDAGCGNGITAISILKKYANAKVYGFDYSKTMVQEAKSLGDEEGVSDRLKLEVGDLTCPPFSEKLFDAVYTERSLINLNGQDQQKIAISALVNKLKPNGRIVLCESFKDGLEEINSFRSSVGLDEIQQPWHNNYFRVKDLESLIPEDVEIEKIVNFSSTYYFLSRVVNAWLAKQNQEEPSYDALINKLAFSMPNLELCSQAKIVVLKKRI